MSLTILDPAETLQAEPPIVGSHAWLVVPMAMGLVFLLVGMVR